MMKVNQRERGYSLTELLVVLAIIGIFSLITVPQFMSMYRSGLVKGSMREFTSSLRKARQLAATRNERVRVRFKKAASGTTIQIERGGTDPLNPTWVVMSPTRKLDPTTYIDSSTTLPTTSGFAEVNFLPNGSAVDSPSAGTMPSILTNGNNTVIIRSSWKNMTYNQYTVVVGTSGQLTVTPSKWR